ncbi:DUF6197 family protein [Streptomyces sp. DSM 41013]
MTAARGPARSHLMDPARRSEPHGHPQRRRIGPAAGRPGRRPRPAAPGPGRPPDGRVRPHGRAADPGRARRRGEHRRTTPRRRRRAGRPGRRPPRPRRRPALAPADLYPTPAAALLQRARARLERDGWCQGSTVDEDGARCLYGALRAEAADAAELHDALAVLLDAIRRHFPDEETVPGFNDRHGARVVLRALDQAADLAHARTL